MRILIYRAGAIGDTIVAIPAIRAIREQYPDAMFVLMTAGGGEKIIWSDRVLREFRWFDEILIYEAVDLRSPRFMWSFLRRIRDLHLDVVYYLGTDKNSLLRIVRDRIFFRIAGVPRFVGTRTEKVTFWGRLRRSPRLYPHETDRLVDDMRRGGIVTATARFDLPIGARHRERVDEALKSSGLDLSRPMVAVCPGSKQPIKIWPEDRFGELGKRLIVEAGVNIVVIGGSEDVAVGNRLVIGWPAGHAADLVNHLSILESAELLRRCAFYLGNDTGAMHIAAAVGTRCVAIFGAREPVRSWHPYGENHFILRRSVPCQNCYLSACVKERLRCLLDISVDDVWASCQRLLIYK